MKNDEAIEVRRTRPCRVVEALTETAEEIARNASLSGVYATASRRVPCSAALLRMQTGRSPLY
jgi:hypothetical protein